MSIEEKSIKKLRNLYDLHAGLFVEGERLMAATDFLFLTNMRIFQINMLSRIKVEFRIEEIESLSTTRKTLAKAGPIIVNTKDGGEHKLTNLLDSEWRRFSDAFDLLTSKHVGDLESSIPTLNQSEKPRTNSGYAPDNIDTGESVLSLLFGSHNVELFKNGFVKVSSVYGLRNRGIERIIDIQGESQLTKKTGLGRALAATVTLGANMASPSQRGNLIVTITTETDIHVLIHNVPFDHDIENMNKIVSTGKAVIRANSASSGIQTNANPILKGNIVEEVKELVLLRDSGVISDEEFVLLKRKLISGS